MAIKHTIRARGNKTIEMTLTPIKAIGYFCRECYGFEPVVDGINWIDECLSPLCPLYPFRQGDTHEGRKGSIKQQEYARKHIKRINSKKLAAAAA